MLIFCFKFVYVLVISDVIIYLDYWLCKICVDDVKFCEIKEFFYLMVWWCYFDFFFNVRYNINNISFVIIRIVGWIVFEFFLNWFGIIF